MEMRRRARRERDGETSECVVLGVFLRKWRRRLCGDHFLSASNMDSNQFKVEVVSHSHRCKQAV